MYAFKNKNIFFYLKSLMAPANVHIEFGNETVAVLAHGYFPWKLIAFLGHTLQSG
jgi:hypothetical protein